MEIKTTDGKIVNTNLLSDIKSEMVELVEKSGIRDFAMKNNGMCYVLTAVPGNNKWSTFHLKDKRDIDYLLNCVNEIFLEVTNNKYQLAVVPKE
jgi:hypothetical protein